MKKFRDNKGITLVALVITIIILLILSAVTILKLTESGLFGNAKRAEEKSKEAMDRENMLLGDYENAIDIYTANNRNNGNNNGNNSTSSIINDFTPTVEANFGKSLKVKANATAKDNSTIAGYIYLLNGEVKEVCKTDSFTYTNLNSLTKYDIEIIAIDKLGNIKKSSKIDVTTSNALVSRYIIVDLFEHFNDSPCATINELEIYNNLNQKYSYTPMDAYDSSRGAYPYYWNSGGLWSNDNLYDGSTTYTGNSDGSANSCLFLYGGTCVEGEFARFIVDLGSEKDIKNIRISLGSPEGRIPKSVSVYTLDTSNYVSGTGENSTYTKNLVNRSDENLNLLHKEDLTATCTTPQWYDFYGTSN